MVDATSGETGDDRAFGQRLRAAMEAHGPLCAGIDPHRALVESWGMGYDVDGLARFTDACVEAFAGHVGGLVESPQPTMQQTRKTRSALKRQVAMSSPMRVPPRRTRTFV